MVFVSYVHVLSAAFLMGLAAAAPMGPVNMLAIRRGVIGGWRIPSPAESAPSHSVQ
jgi:threonine/homoserine/homoserine lactone efflux protein